MVRQRAWALWVVGCVPVNPGLCIEPERRPPEGLPRRKRAPLKSFQLLLADPLDGPAGRHKAMPPARSRCG